MSQRQTKKTAKTKHSPVFWLFIGLLIGCFTTGVFYIYQQLPKQMDQQVAKSTLPHDARTPITASIDDDIQPLRKKSKSVQTEPTEKPHFDFYTLLPGIEVPAEDTTKKTVQVNSPKQSAQPAKTPTTTNKSIFLQVGAFKDRDQADQLRAQLTLEGQPVNLKKVTVNQQTLYRVYLGPYTNQSTAEATQSKLAKQNVHTLLVNKV